MFKVDNNIVDVVLVSLLLTLLLTYLTPFSSVSVVNFEHVNVCWQGCLQSL